MKEKRYEKLIGMGGQRKDGENRTRISQLPSFLAGPLWWPRHIHRVQSRWRRCRPLHRWSTASCGGRPTERRHDTSAGTTAGNKKQSIRTKNTVKHIQRKKNPLQPCSPAQRTTVEFIFRAFSRIFSHYKSKICFLKTDKFYISSLI